MCKDTRILRTIANCAGLSSKDQGALHGVADRIAKRRRDIVEQIRKQKQRDAESFAQLKSNLDDIST